MLTVISYFSDKSLAINPKRVIIGIIFAGFFVMPYTTILAANVSDMYNDKTSRPAVLKGTLHIATGVISTCTIRIKPVRLFFINPFAKDFPFVKVTTIFILVAG